jgi:hypothetical protein
MKAQGGRRAGRPGVWFLQQMRKGCLFLWQIYDVCTIEVLGELRSGRHGSSRRRARSSASRRWAAATGQRSTLLSSLGRRCVHPSADLFGELREPESGREKREKSSSRPRGAIGHFRLRPSVTSRDLLGGCGSPQGGGAVAKGRCGPPPIYCPHTYFTAIFIAFKYKLHFISLIKISWSFSAAKLCWFMRILQN